MAVIATIGKKEDFLVQMNGDYNVPFDEVSVTVAGALPAGTVLETAAKAVDGSSAAVFGILAADKPAGTQWCRVMVRGNPTTVNRQALEYGAATPATIDALLAAKGIVVVNV